MGSGILQRIKSGCRWLWYVAFIVTVALHLILAMTKIPAAVLINSGVYQIANIGFPTQIVSALSASTNTGPFGAVMDNSNYGPIEQVCPHYLSVRSTFDDCARDPFRSLVSGTSKMPGPNNILPSH